MDMDISPNLKLRVHLGSFTPLSVARRDSSSPALSPSNQVIGFLKYDVAKGYVLRLFISLKYITANVVDRNNGRIVATSLTVEHSVKQSLECGRTCNAKAAAIVGEVLAMRLKVEGLDQAQVNGIHVNVNKEVEKKGFTNRTKVWAIVNGLKSNGVKLILDDNENDSSRLISVN